MIYAKNRVAVSVTHSEVATFSLDRNKYATKLSVYVRADDPVILQVSEMEERYFENESETSMLLEPGFHSRIFDSPIGAWRFRMETGVGEVDFVAYA